MLTLLGGGLRLLQLGRDSFWFDEAGVAKIVTVQSLSEFVNLVRSHVMAVPLDYAVTWLVGQRCTSEACLRLPSAVWGTLALPVGYLLCRELFNARTARRAALLMTLSPFLVQYSQELRFYSSLVFFYLLSSYLLYRALAATGKKWWVLSACSLCVGLFFHIFSIFALLNGWVWFVFKNSGRSERLRLLRGLAAVSLAVMFALLAAYFSFIGYTAASLEHNLFDFESSPVRLFGVALGWIPYYESAWSAVWLWGMLCCLFEITGLVVVLRQNPKSPAAGLIYSSLAQMAAILAANLAKHYALAPRQLIALLPFGLFLAAFGSLSAGEWISARLAVVHPRASAYQLVNGFILAALLIASLPALQDYYAAVKSRDRETAAYLAQHWHSGDTIIAIPMTTAETLNYYLSDQLGRKEMAAALRQATEQDLDKVLSWQGSVFLIAPQSINTGSAGQLAQAGFVRTVIQDEQGRVERVIWIRQSFN